MLIASYHTNFEKKLSSNLRIARCRVRNDPTSEQYNAYNLHKNYFCSFESLFKETVLYSSIRKREPQKIISVS